MQCILGNRILFASTIWYTKVIFRQDIIIINSKAVKVKAAEAVKPNNSIQQARIFCGRMDSSRLGVGERDTDGHWLHAASHAVCKTVELRGRGGAI